MVGTLCACAMFSKMLLSRPMSTSRLCTKFEVCSSFRLGCRVTTDRQTDRHTDRQTDHFSKTTFWTQGPLNRVENTKYRYRIFDPIAILSIPYMLYQVIESKKTVNLCSLDKTNVFLFLWL